MLRADVESIRRGHAPSGNGVARPVRNRNRITAPSEKDAGEYINEDEVDDDADGNLMLLLLILTPNRVFFAW